jgi:hypothetical protein
MNSNFTTMKRKLILSEKTVLQMEKMNKIIGGEIIDVEVSSDYIASVASICDNSPRPKAKVPYPCR